MVNSDVIGISPEIKGKVRRLRKWPQDSEVLHTPCEPITEFDEELHVLIADLFATLDNHEDGIALAANQAGIGKRIFVARLPLYLEKPNTISPTATPEYDEMEETFVCVNPEIVYKDYRSQYTYEEGCLSIPNHYELKTRLGKIELDYYDANGHKKSTQFQGLPAFAVQHEMDHLDGKLFIDDVSKLKLSLIRKKVKKKRKKTSAVGLI